MDKTFVTILAVFIVIALIISFIVLFFSKNIPIFWGMFLSLSALSVCFVYFLQKYANKVEAMHLEK